MNSEEMIKRSLVVIASVIAKSYVDKLVYDVHFEGQITAKNEDGTFEVWSNEKNAMLHAVKWSTSAEPNVGDHVQVRETKNVQNSYMIDYIES